MSNQYPEFQQMIWQFYREHKREMPWRNTTNPYHIVVSEIMLQQTQVPRVMIKYPEFIVGFPTFESLAKADFTSVLSIWQGMGYNRRAKYLKEIATIVTEKYGGKLPDDPTILQTFPGLGYATAHSIVAFTFNKPVVFIETNIRRIFIHHFFQDQEGVHDKNIMPLVAATLDPQNPREWYYALMDYGTKLAKDVVNPNRKSKHYTKQSTFEGSDRQMRGEILRYGLKEKKIDTHDLLKRFSANQEKVHKLLADLEKEGFLVKDGEEDYKIKS